RKTELGFLQVVPVLDMENPEVRAKVEEFERLKANHSSSETKLTMSSKSSRSRSLCGVASHRMRIIGGKQASEDYYPWQALIRILGKVNSTHSAEANCGGSVISSTWILTAAHCLDSKNFKTTGIEVWIGAH
ncbi:unnamed protein product, partial [Notodromas monacha]